MPNALSARVQREVRGLSPAYFALVMATGIVSIATARLHHGVLSPALLAAALLFYAVLVALFLWRSVAFSRHLLSDLRNPEVNFGFFTFVAGTNVLGARLALAGETRIAAAFWAVGLAGWVVLIYYSMFVLIFRNERSLGQVVNGGWLVAIVATQSVCILTTALEHGGLLPAEPALLLAWGAWAVGSFFYALFITFILLRLAFSRTDPAAIQPAYWINMGALAISTVAGAALAAAAGDAEFAAVSRPFVYTSTVALWSGGTWWLPLIVAMGVWKHLVKGVPLGYDPALWSMVFPLGMYTVATLEVGSMTGLGFLEGFASLFVWVALIAWAATFLGLLARLKGVAWPGAGARAEADGAHRGNLN